MNEVEEEERLKRLGPGGLDPVEVYQSLPKVNAFTHTKGTTISGRFCSAQWAFNV